MKYWKALFCCCKINIDDGDGCGGGNDGMMMLMMVTVMMMMMRMMMMRCHVGRPNAEQMKYWNAGFFIKSLSCESYSWNFSENR